MDIDEVVLIQFQHFYHVLPKLLSSRTSTTHEDEFLDTANNWTRQTDKCAIGSVQKLVLE